MLAEEFVVKHNICLRSQLVFKMYQYKIPECIARRKNIARKYYSITLKNFASVKK